VPATLRCQVRFQAVSGKTEDDLTNTWHFDVVTTPPAAGTLTAISDALKAFYDNCAGSIVADWSQTVTLKYYNLADPMPRTPITTHTRVLASFASAVNSMPREVSPCVSFKAIPVSGVPAGRRRGRIYLPCFGTAAYDNTGMIATSIVTAVRNAANGLLTASTGASDWDWVIYSQKNAATSVVSSGWVDNAPDIQRRRGRDATSRNIFP